MDLKVFENPEFGRIRMVEREGDPWFVGKDVAQALGYGEGKSLANAVANHVDEEDKGVTELMTPGGKQKMTSQAALKRRRDNPGQFTLEELLVMGAAFRWTEEDYLAVIRAGM